MQRNCISNELAIKNDAGRNASDAQLDRAAEANTKAIRKQDGLGVLALRGSKMSHATRKTAPEPGIHARESPSNKCKITREERALLIEIERGGSNGSVSMRGLDKAAKGLIAKGLGYSVGRIGGGHYTYSTVKGSACLGIDWDNGPRPSYDERKGAYVISTNGTFEAS